MVATLDGPGCSTRRCEMSIRALVRPLALLVETVREQEPQVGRRDPVAAARRMKVHLMEELERQIGDASTEATQQLRAALVAGDRETADRARARLKSLNRRRQRVESMLDVFVELIADLDDALRVDSCGG